jgi:hypothetical protein
LSHVIAKYIHCEYNLNDSGVGKRGEKMLGELLYEGRGKPVGMRLLQNGKLEQTVVMQGTFLGEELQTTWTGEIETRHDGTQYVEAWGFFITSGGNRGTYKVIGNGIMNPDGSGNSRGVVCYNCPPGKFAYLNGIAVMYEIEFDKEWNMINKGWEWK